MQFSRRCCTVGIPDVRSPLFHHFPVLCRDGGMYNKTGGAYLYAREAFGPFAGVFGGLDDVAFVHHWLGLGR